MTAEVSHSQISKGSRRRVQRGLAVCLVAVAFAVQPALAQPPEPPAPAVIVLDKSIRVSPEGQVEASILIDRAGQPQQQIESSDLTVRFGGQLVSGPAVSPILTVPVQVALGLDVSQWNAGVLSHTSALTTAVLAAGSIISEAAGSTFIAFPFSLTVPATPTNAGLDWLNSRALWRGNRTNLYGAIERAAAALAALPPAAGRRSILILTNSGHTLNTTQRDASGKFINDAARAITAAGEAGAPVYVFVVEEAGHALTDARKANLRAFAWATGGDMQVIDMAHTAGLADALRKMVAGLKTGHTLTFTSPVRVDKTNVLEIGVAPAKLTSGPSIDQPPQLTATLSWLTSAVSLSDTLALANNDAWRAGIQEVIFFANGVQVKTVDTTPFELTLEEISKMLPDWQQVETLTLTATVNHRLNKIAPPQPLTLTLPALPTLTWHVNGSITSTSQLTMAPNVTMTLIAQSSQSNAVSYDVIKEDKVISPNLHGPLVLPMGLSPSNDYTYTILANVEDALGRPVQVTFSLKVLPDDSPILWVLLAGFLLLLLLLMIYLAWQASRQRRRDAAHAESVYCLFNRGNEAVEYVIQADYAESDLRFQFSLVGASDEPALQAQPDAESGKLQLMTPAIAPQDRVRVRVVIDPVKPGALPAYDFRLIARPKCLDAAQAQTHPFTITPGLVAQRRWP